VFASVILKLRISTGVIPVHTHLVGTVKFKMLNCYSILSLQEDGDGNCNGQNGVTVI